MRGRARQTRTNADKLETAVAPGEKSYRRLIGPADDMAPVRVYSVATAVRSHRSCGIRTY